MGEDRFGQRLVRREARLGHDADHDLLVDRSARFYSEALGFAPGPVYQVGAPFEKVMELKGELKLHSRFYSKDGLNIELLGFDSPDSTGAAERRPMNQLGLTHLSLNVDDVDAGIDRIVRYGGRVYPHTRVNDERGAFAFCTDPDGVRIELMHLEG